MKINQQDYARLEKLVNVTLEKNPTAKAGYIAKGLSRTRFCWDTFHVTTDRLQREDVENYLWMRGLYDRLNDSHIETALKAITGDYSGDMC